MIHKGSFAELYCWSEMCHTHVIHWIIEYLDVGASQTSKIAEVSFMADFTTNDTELQSMSNKVHQQRH